MHTIVLTLCNYFYKSPDILFIYLLIAGGTVHHQRHAQKTAAGTVLHFITFSTSELHSDKTLMFAFAEVLFLDQMETTV